MDKFVLPPGFRFHPTDEELVSHYLRRKVCGRRFDFDAIGELDLYNYEPWDLPEKSFLQTRDLEWYFFIPRDRKYPNGSRTNRATEKGYWKSTGKDRYISTGTRAVGTKKTLVYYNGRAPKGERTNWVMHEYRLNDVECQRVNAPENGFVLCRIYQKSGAGPKNGEQYGAPVEDEEFDSLSPAGGDGSGSFKAGLLEAGPSTANGHYDSSPTTGSRNEAVSHEDNKVHLQFIDAGFQPRNLKFEDLLGNATSDLVQMESVTNHNGTGSIVLPGYGGENFVASACLEEEDILQDLYKSLQTSACDNKLGSTTDGDLVETGLYQLPPSDGDFLELNDLICEDGINALQSDDKQTNGRLENFSNESECTSLLQSQVVSTFPNMLQDCNGQWQDLPFGDGTYEKQQNLPESGQMQSSMSTVTYDSQYQPSRDDLLESLIASSDLYNEELGVACQTDAVEPDFEDVLELFARAKEDKSFNLESFAENIQRELHHSEDNSLLPSQDGQYYDALLSFTDIDMYGETRSTALHTASNFGPQASLIGEVDGVLDKLDIVERPEGVVEPHDFASQNGLLSHGEVITLAQGKQPLSPLSILWSCLDSLPTLPASAADLSPKALSPEVMNAGRFVKSLSFRQRSKPTDKRRIGYYTSAVFGALWAIFGLLIAGGAWKLCGSMYRKMVGSET